MMYLSGAITNCPDYFEHFDNVKTRLEAKSITVISPAHEIERADGKEWADYMAEAICLMRMCNSVYMLNNWRKSTGARLEHALALRWNKTVIYEK